MNVYMYDVNNKYILYKGESVRGVLLSDISNWYARYNIDERAQLAPGAIGLNMWIRGISINLSYRLFIMG